ncbi:MAG: signal peptidase II [Clostridia bacterium]
MLTAITALVIIILVVIDQLIKVIAQSLLLSAGEPVSFISGFLQFRYVENTGAAFGFLSEHTDLLTGVTAAVIIVITILFFVGIFTHKVQPGVFYISAILLISGGLGNLIDRILRGYVIDYIEPVFIDFAVFNFADCLVTVGAGLLIIWLICDIVSEYRKERKEKREHPPQPGEDRHV